MFQKLLGSLRTRLFMLVLLCIAPAFGLMSYMASENPKDCIQTAQENMLLLARMVAGDRERVIEETYLLLMR